MIVKSLFNSCHDFAAALFTTVGGKKGLKTFPLERSSIIISLSSKVHHAYKNWADN